MRKQAVAFMFIVSAMVAGLMVVGCGGGDDNAEAAPPIAKTAFAKKANAICEATKEEMNPAFTELLKEYAQKDQQKIRDAEAKYVEETLVPGIQSELEEIRAVGLPRGEEKEAEKVLATIEEVNNAAEEDPGAYPRDVDFDESEKLADDIGAESCPIG